MKIDVEIIEKMPPGTYFLGDLYHVLNDEVLNGLYRVNMDVICYGGFEGKKIKIRFLNYEDEEIIIHTFFDDTYIGDFKYIDQFKNEYFVHSGTFGCIEINQHIEHYIEELKKKGVIIKTEKEFRPNKDLNENFNILSYIIPTKDEQIISLSEFKSKIQ